jgi:hypothetical protein
MCNSEYNGLTFMRRIKVIPPQKNMVDIVFE